MPMTSFSGGIFLNARFLYTEGNFFNDNYTETCLCENSIRCNKLLFHLTNFPKSKHRQLKNVQKYFSQLKSYTKIKILNSFSLFYDSVIFSKKCSLEKKNFPRFNFTNAVVSSN